MKNNQTFIQFNLNSCPINKEVIDYFNYRYGDIEYKKIDGDFTRISIKVGTELSKALIDGIKSNIEQNMILYDLICSDWDFRETNI